MAQKSNALDVKAISLKLQNLLQIPSAAEKVELTGHKQLPGFGTEDKEQMNSAYRHAQDIVSVSRNPGELHKSAEHIFPTSTRHFTSGLMSDSKDNIRKQRTDFHQFDSFEPMRSPLGLPRKYNELTPGKKPTTREPPLLNSKVGLSSSMTDQSYGTFHSPGASSNLRVDKSSVPLVICQMMQRVECPNDVKSNMELFLQAASVDTPRCSQDANYFMLFNRRVKEILNHHLIETLNKRSTKFPRARFYCRVCNYHMDSILSSVNHIVNERHYTQERYRKLENVIGMIPNATKEHTSALENLILCLAFELSLSKAVNYHRLSVLQMVKDAITDTGLECEVSLFGSSVSGFGFNGADININIGVDKDSMQWNTFNAECFHKPSIVDDNMFQLIVKSLERLPPIEDIREAHSGTRSTIEFVFRTSKTRDHCCLMLSNTSAVLLSQLFHEYDILSEHVKPLVVAFRHLARMCDMDVQEEGFLPSHCFSIMVLHYLQEVGEIPVLHSYPKGEPNRPFATAAEAHQWTSRNTMQIGQLWLGLLRYYAIEFDYKDRVVSISRTEKLARSEKQWNRRLSIEDPIMANCNVARSATNNKICDYIIERIKLAYLYFGVPRNAKGPLYHGIIGNDMTTTSGSNSFTRTAFCDNVFRDNRISIQDDFSNENYEGAIGRTTSSGTGVSKARMVKVQNHAGQLEDFVLQADAIILHSCLSARDYKYDFNYEIFSGAPPPPLFCKSCGLEGHTKNYCPDKIIPPVSQLCLPSGESLARLNSVLYTNYNVEALTTEDLATRTRIVMELQLLLSRLYPDVLLTLFGSSKNRFGLHDSDLDICLTFSSLNVPLGENALHHIDVNKVLMNVVAALKSCGRMNEILPITSAKVPIVKFRHKIHKLEGDISLYNVTAIHNTSLLRAYADLDSRVVVLGCFLKKLGKICDISDASKASLSSYGYILMMIHFLQRHEIPVLPVLQEIAPIRHPANYPLPVRIVDDVNTYFFEDIGHIGEVWEGFGRNTETVEQLWLAFLRYYTEIFNFDELVVTISQSGTLTRKSKFWYTESLAIEDPFDKTHNLGAGLSRRMSVHIVKTLQSFRVHFHSPSDFVPLRSSFDWYMDVNKLRNGDPPIDRQCRLCNRIGHIARNCTYSGKNEVAEDEDDALPLESLSLKLNEGLNRTSLNEPLSNSTTECSPVYGDTTNHLQMNLAGCDSGTYPRMPPYPFSQFPYENITWSQNGFLYNQMIANTSRPNFYNSQGNNVPEQRGDFNISSSDLTFFWNFSDIPRTADEYQLLQMIKSSKGVVFTNAVTDKAETIHDTGLDNNRAQFRNSSGPALQLPELIQINSQENVISSNGMNGSLADQPNLHNRLGMQLPDPSIRSYMFGAPGMQAMHYAGLAGPFNGFGITNINQQGSTETQPLPPPPGFASLFP